MPRANRGRHVIIENETHARIKGMCNEAGVLMTTICDTVMRQFVVEMEGMDATVRNKIFQEIAGGVAFAKAFAPFATLIKLASEGDTIVDISGEGKGSVTPENKERAAQEPPQ